jgi:hypothetical protein
MCLNTLVMYLGSPHMRMAGWVGIYRALSPKESLEGGRLFVSHQTSLVGCLCHTELVRCPSTLASHFCIDRFSAPRKRSGASSN